MKHEHVLNFGKHQIGLGERKDVSVAITESFVGATIKIPAQVWRGAEPGPQVFVTGAVHGDELNGTGAIRRLLNDPGFELARGTLILVPVVNILGFDRNSRYMPDRRDLNRSFPGSQTGSLASRYAREVFQNVVRACDYGIDLHTAAVRRTNFPNVRADLSNPDVRRIARAFGCELIVNGKGPKGSLRRSACDAGVPTIICEAGEVWKVEPSVVDVYVRGVRNVLAELGMVDGKPSRAAYQVEVERTRWIRAKMGGFLQFHVAPGDVVEKGQPLATNSSLLGREQNVVLAHAEGVIMGMTTLPAVVPGAPICHLAIPPAGIQPIRKAMRKISDEHLHERVRGDLASNMVVSERPADEPVDSGKSGARTR